MKQNLSAFWQKIKRFFKRLKFWTWTITTQERIEYLVELQIACREKFHFYFNVKNKKEVKQVEALLTKVFYREDGSLRPGPEARRIARKIKLQADANAIASKNAASKPKTKFREEWTQSRRKLTESPLSTQSTRTKKG